MTGPSTAQSSLDCLRRLPDRLMRAFEYRTIHESISESLRIHSEFIAPSFNAAAKNDGAGYRNRGGAWESSPRGKEGTSKTYLSDKVGELGSRPPLDGYG
jgi:uncharacterized protein with von Willebrand factor type A (vWA) domain